MEHLGMPWDTLEHSWNALERLWIPLNTLKHLGTSWDNLKHLGTPWNPDKPLEHMETPWNNFERLFTPCNTLSWLRTSLEQLKIYGTVVSTGPILSILWAQFNWQLSLTPKKLEIPLSDQPANWPTNMTGVRDASELDIYPSIHPSIHPSICPSKTNKKTSHLHTKFPNKIMIQNILYRHTTFCMAKQNFVLLDNWGLYYEKKLFTPCLTDVSADQGWMVGKHEK